MVGDEGTKAEGTRLIHGKSQTFDNLTSHITFDSLSVSHIMLALIDLPHDILIHICTQLEPKDFLNFIQVRSTTNGFRSR